MELFYFDIINFLARKYNSSSVVGGVFFRIHFQLFPVTYIHTLDRQSLQRGLLSLVQQQQHKMKRAKPKKNNLIQLGFFRRRSPKGLHESTFKTFLCSKKKVGFCPNK